jgi:hypothetical protein
MSRRLPILLAASLALAAPGCSLNSIVAGRMAATFADMTRAFEAEESVEDAREAAPALLKMLDGIIEMAPDNERLLEQAAEMNATFSFGFIEEDDPARARLLYRKARGYGLRALAERDGDLRRALELSEADLRARLASLDGDDDALPALFWTAFAWGGEINVSRGDARVVADLGKVVAVMERLAEIAPRFYHGGPHIFLAVYYASRGRTLGGDPAKAARHFAEVAKITGGRFLLRDVLYARYYCVALGETDPARARSEFQAALRRVREAPIDIHPEQKLANALAKARAAKLELQLDDLILPPLPGE